MITNATLLTISAALRSTADHLDRLSTLPEGAMRTADIGMTMHELSINAKSTSVHCARSLTVPDVLQLIEAVMTNDAAAEGK